MNHDFLIGSAQLNQAFESQERSGGGVTRRSFVKRTGAATVATLVAWNIKAHAEVKDDSEGQPGSKKGWQIRVDGVSFVDKSTGSNQKWDHDGNPQTASKDVRKTLTVTVNASGTNWDSSATSALTVTIAEWADYKPNPTTKPNEWAPMSQADFNTYRGGSQDIHSTSASITKSIDSDSGVVSDHPSTPENGYNETENGIHLEVSWEGDQLKVTWGAGDNPANETKTVEPVFHIRPQTITAE